jgi:glycosyltransferase involved in cell wall biosynthesis
VRSECNAIAGKVRVLHLITRLPIGGAERMLLGVLRNLDHASFESVVCCIQERGELAAEVEALGVPVICLGFMSRGGHDRRVVPALRRLVRDQQINVMHTHLYHANLYGRLAAIKEGVPVIASVHNTYSRTKWHRRLLNRFLARRTYAITAGSVEVERDLIEIDGIPPEKVLRLSNCIDLARVSTALPVADAKARFGFNPQDSVIGTVGRAEEQKGQIFLIEAFARVRAMPGKESMKLLVVGDGRLLPRLKDDAVRLGVAEHCRFPGNIALLADVYRAMDLFVLPSLWEGLSLALLEAMAAEVPVIATDVGGSREVLGEDQFGVVIPSKSAGAIANAVNRVFADPAAAAIRASAGAEHVSANFSVKSLAARLSALYVSAVSPSVPRA